MGSLGRHDLSAASTGATSPPGRRPAASPFAGRPPAQVHPQRAARPAAMSGRARRDSHLGSRPAPSPGGCWARRHCWPRPSLLVPGWHNECAWTHLPARRRGAASPRTASPSPPLRSPQPSGRRPASPPGPIARRPVPAQWGAAAAGPGWAGRGGYKLSLCCPAPFTGTWWAPRLSSTCRRRRASATWAKVSSSRTCCGPGLRALPSSVPSPPTPCPSSCAPRRNKSTPQGVPSRQDGLSKCLTPRRRTAAARQRGPRRRREAESSRRQPQVSAGPSRVLPPGRRERGACRGLGSALRTAETAAGEARPLRGARRRRRDAEPRWVPCRRGAAGAAPGAPAEGLALPLATGRRGAGGAGRRAAASECGRPAHLWV